VDAIGAYAQFRYPSLDADGRPCLRKEGVVSWRNNHSPGRVAYGLIPHAALELRNPIAIRLARLYLDHGRLWSLRLDPRNAHFIAHVTSAMDLLDSLDRLQALPAAETRLPMERRGGTHAWADEVAGAVALRHRGVRLYASLHWRHGFKPDAKGRSPDDAAPHHIARIHCTTPTLDRIATLAMPPTHGPSGLSLCRYGPYLIAMNAHPENTCRVPAPARGKAHDLISGRLIGLDADLEIPPSTTFVLYLPSPH
jgi:hypothetical protein